MKTLRLLVTVAVFLGFAGTPPLGATAERPLKATLTVARGDAKMSLQKDAAFEPAQPGAVLTADARVATGADGSAELLFEDGTAVRVEANSSLTLETARQTADSREFSLRLWAGRLLSQVMKRDTSARYSVRTPAAVAAVRGTEFVADAADGSTGLAVFEGTVETQSLDGDKPLGDPVALQPNQELSVEKGHPAGPPRAISAAMEQYRQGIAALFQQRMEDYRRNTAKVIQLQRDFMLRRQQQNRDAMEKRRRENADQMERFRRRTQQRTPSSDAP
jgi:ferric-dicitrate binding protein FerR (iron transport regulator)